MRYRRVPAGTRETLTAAAAGVGVATVVGLAAFYLTRMFLAREHLSGPEPPPRASEAGMDGDGGA